MLFSKKLNRKITEYIIIMFGFTLSTQSNNDTYEQIFSSIYTNAIWGRNSEGNGHSGGGSTIKNTLVYTKFLREFIDTHHITSVVDVGCGDWEFSSHFDWSTIYYIGYDIVEHVIKRNIAKYETESIHFIHANFLKEDLPKADLLLCKHVLQHIPNQDIIPFLPQLSKFKYCVIVNEVDPRTLSSNNENTSIGGGHKIDLTCHPFNVAGKKVLNYYIGNAVHQIFLIDNSKQ